MQDHLRDRILRKLETLSDERGYQVLDYVEFLEGKYAERSAPAANVFQRFAEAVEDRLRAGQVSAQAVSETMGLMNRAMGVLSGVAAAGKSVANDIVGAAAAATRTPPRPGEPAGGTGGTGGAGAATSGGATTGAGAPGAAAAASRPTADAATAPAPSTPAQGMDQ
ncbi:MAG TPA: hypothetical protein VFZ11_00535 [Gemmatimonadaceae bacterium]